MKLINIKSKIAVCSCAAALALPGAFSAQMHGQPSVSEEPKIPSEHSLTCEEPTSTHIGQESAPQPEVRLVSAYTKGDRAVPPPAPHPTRVGEETANVESDSNHPTGIDFEPQKPNAVSEILTVQEPLRDNPTPSTTASQTPSHHAPVAPQTGNTRTADGQNQVYILGFGWVTDCGGSDEGIAVDGVGDINKMVGTMD